MFSWSSKECVVDAVLYYIYIAASVECAVYVNFLTKPAYYESYADIQMQ